MSDDQLALFPVSDYDEVELSTEAKVMKGDLDVSLTLRLYEPQPKHLDEGTYVVSPLLRPGYGCVEEVVIAVERFGPRPPNGVVYRVRTHPEGKLLQFTREDLLAVYPPESHRPSFAEIAREFCNQRRPAPIAGPIPRPGTASFGVPQDPRV